MQEQVDHGQHGGSVVAPPSPCSSTSSLAFEEDQRIVDHPRHFDRAHLPTTVMMRSGTEVSVGTKQEEGRATSTTSSSTQQQEYCRGAHSDPQQYNDQSKSTSPQ